MHLTLKQDATRPAGANVLAQQETFDAFRKTFNDERPHEALGMKTPSDVYRRSERQLPDTIAALEYPLHDLTSRVKKKGSFYMPSLGLVFLGEAFAYQDIGIREVESGTWLVSFMELDIGYLDAETKRIIDLPTDNHEPT